MTPEDKKWIKRLLKDPNYPPYIERFADIIKAQEKEIKNLLSWLKIAASRIEEWGAYANDYYQEKWNLKGDIKQIVDVVRAYESRR